jgi:hypothetical protein
MSAKFRRIEAAGGSGWSCKVFRMASSSQTKPYMGDNIAGWSRQEYEDEKRANCRQPQAGWN